MEVQFSFELDLRATVCGFRAVNITTGSAVEGVIMEKEKAMNKYDDSIAEGKTSYLLRVNGR